MKIGENKMQLKYKIDETVFDNWNESITSLAYLKRNYIHVVGGQNLRNNVYV